MAVTYKSLSDANAAAGFEKFRLERQTFEITSWTRTRRKPRTVARYAPIVHLESRRMATCTVCLKLC
ncbi:hypothetical protein BDN72DRAFT_850885 [Pluteus cervinus]|uniref:Uncharacterized protein n=1 Tax=Pluteus cervinus TaxID=181527 RepID=A0ACD3A2X8_9AGAR|nr:hypothetical protein BDN72DRAFT_850885 [Pluteus cervinus]